MSDNNHRNELFSKSVRAGRRTYFFDVKSTRTNEYYLTITESKRRTADDGGPFYEKHKIFVYREDFDKFFDCLTESMNCVLEALEKNPASPEPSKEASSPEPE